MTEKIVSDGTELGWWQELCNKKDKKIVSLEAKVKMLESQNYRLTQRLNENTEG